ncbi:MAG: hypothetical protein JWM27_4910 [Gemmatimonadetes bacterium]|nr:hypothetical protein [Gemmatimonadota bacterium]
MIVRRVPSRGILSARVAYLLVIALLIANPSIAQEVFSTQEKFMAAEENALPGRLELRPRSSYDELNVIVDSARLALNRFYGVSPQFRWSGIPGARNSYARPDVGIVISEARTAELRDELDTKSLSDVIRFLLAHETAHIAQYQRYGFSSVTAPSWRRAAECHADMWAAMALVNLLVDAGTSLDEARRRTRSAYQLANAMGEVRWVDAQHHPTPEQRVLCTSVGTVAGLQLFLIRRFQESGEDVYLREIKRWQTALPAGLPTLFAPGDSVWPWTRQAAEAIVDPQSSLWTDTPFSLPEWIIRTASSATHGPSALAAEASKPLPPAPAKCKVHAREGFTELVCFSPVSVSASAVTRYYESRVGLFEILLRRIGWSAASRCFSTDGPVAVWVDSRERAAVEVAASMARLGVSTRVFAADQATQLHCGGTRP